MPGFSQSRFAARLQNVVSRRREEVGLYREIADRLPLDDAERVLDVGTGSGLQLRAIRESHPEVALYGLDLSAEAVRVAEQNLADIKVDIRVGSIESTTFEDDFFDVVTCNASMSYWKNLVACFDEVYRILKPGGAAVLFEPRKNIDIDEAIRILKQNLAGESWLRRFAASTLNRFALRWGRAVGLTLYSMEELAEIAQQSRFGDHVSIQPAIPQNLPVFMRIELTKPEGTSA
jgi:ubiquinone/menaquinone biosynthesis C-methylase UbiE